MQIRPFDPKRDRDAARRIWYEVGWSEKDKDQQLKALDAFVATGHGLVGEIHGEVECLVVAHPGTIQYLGVDLPLQGVMAVTASFLARKKGMSGKLTAALVAEGASEGALVSGLGIFDQGYYDKLGFGCGPYEPRLAFCPSQLKLPQPARAPHRLTAEHGEAMHAARLARKRGHGAVSFTDPIKTTSEVAWDDKSFGLGYFDGTDGALSHHLWFRLEEIGRGPLHVEWMTYQTAEQFLELMALLRDLDDQIRMVRMREPQGIQLQDLLDRPFKHRDLTHGGRFANHAHAVAGNQYRINDVPACMAHTHIPAQPVHFNLKLSDPIEHYLDDDSPWRGVAGDYVVSLGPESAAAPGHESSLPTLTASVNAFTRLWMGVQPATGLAVTDALEGSEELLDALDVVFCLPSPRSDWEF
jgi:hypothetical protein